MEKPSAGPPEECDEKTQAAAGPGTVSSHFPTVRLFAETKTERPKCKQYDNIRRKTFVLCGTCSLRAGYQWRNAVICQSDGGSSARMRTHPVTSAESNRRPHSDAHLVPRLLFSPLVLLIINSRSDAGGNSRK